MSQTDGNTKRYRGGAARVDALTQRQALSVLTYLRGKGNVRDALLWALGITTGLLVSDLLSLRWGDFLDAEGNIAERITVKETKTKKLRSIAVLTAAQSALAAYAEEHRPARSDFLFTGPTGAPLSREQARRLVKSWCAECNLRGRFGSHTMRKTFATAAYANSGGDPVATARVTGHSNPSQLLAYIGESTRTEREIVGGMDKGFGA